MYLKTCKTYVQAADEDVLGAGLAEGFVMFMLALQTDIIEMKMPGRVGAMTIILFITLASLLQTMLEITAPVLMALSASSRNVWNHAKVSI